MDSYTKISEENVNDLDQELFSELIDRLVQPQLLHMVAPFVDADYHNFPANKRQSLMRVEEDGSEKKSFNVLTCKKSFYQFEESAFDCVEMKLK